MSYDKNDPVDLVEGTIVRDRDTDVELGEVKVYEKDGRISVHIDLDTVTHVGLGTWSCGPLER